MKIVVHPNGLMTTTVTMKTILQNAILMGELVAITTLQDGMNTALIVNAYRVKQQQQQPPPQLQQPPQLKVRKFTKKLWCYQISQKATKNGILLPTLF